MTDTTAKAGTPIAVQMSAGLEITCALCKKVVGYTNDRVWPTIFCPDCTGVTVADLQDGRIDAR